MPFALGNIAHWIFPRDPNFAAKAGPILDLYERLWEGAWTYLAAWEVHRARGFGRCEVKNGIAPVDRLVSWLQQLDRNTSP